MFRFIYQTNFKFHSLFMKKLFYLFIGLSMFITNKTLAQTVTFPRNDVADDRQNLYAFTNATIFLDHANSISNGVLLIKGNTILQVGNNISIPIDAVVIDCKGKYIYPSFIESESDYGMPDVKRGERGFYSFDQDSKKKGAYAWNQAIQPEMDASNIFTVNAKNADDLRKIGFGSVITHNHDGIVRGTSILAALIDDKEQIALLKSRVSANYSYSKGSSTQSYPGSMMGSVALLRQTNYDAEWYKNAKNKTEFNISLAAFNQNQLIPQVFDGNDKLGVLRADNVGDEFKKQYIIITGGDEYQRIAEVKATGASLIVPLAFPVAIDVEDPIDAHSVSLSELKHWEMAPANASLLQKAGIEFSLTASQNKNKADFFTNLKKAIEYGLSEQDALKALTTIPAKLFNISDMVGALKPGLLANFLISEGNIFGKDNVLFENWVSGKRHILAQMDVADIRGNYNVKFGDETFKLNITGKAALPEYAIIQMDTIKIIPKVSRNGDFVSFRYSPNKSKNDEVRISSYLEGSQLKGTGEAIDGTNKKFVATLISPYKEPNAKPDTAKAITPIIGKVIYPFVAFGNEIKPQQELLLIKNITLWTNEKDGIQPNMDVLIENGKIQKIGKNLKSTAARNIDGTGKHLTNGIIDEHSHIALTTINEGGQSVTAEVRTSDVIDPEDVDIYRQLAGGTTSAQLLHGSANSIGGQSSIIKLKWGEAAENLKIKGADAFIKFALGENVTRKGAQGFGASANPRYPISRMGVEQVMTDAFTKAKAYDEAWKKYNALSVKDISLAPRKDLELEALAEIINKKRFITCHSYVQSEINMMMKVAEAFNFNINTFTHILEGYKVADLMAKHGVGGSTFSDWWAYKMEVRDAIPYNGALMTKAGVTVAINSDDGEMARRLNQEAAKTILYGGLSEEEAWKTVTLNPAKLLHLDNRMGSIKVGKDADLVLWNNNPLSIYARPEKTIIEGAVYFDLEKEEMKQAENTKERSRLIQKMIQSKSAGAPTKKPSGAKSQLHDCEEMMDGFTIK
jgi:imidazolonepropionase-like amidohydrolase